MRRKGVRFVAVVVMASVAIGCSGKERTAEPAVTTGSTPDSSASSDTTAVPDTTLPVDPSLGLATTTEKGTAPVDKVTWAVYREVGSLDPIFAFDYPENTSIALLCEGLLKQNPKGEIVPGLADGKYPDDTTFVFTLKPGVTFWNGDPVTAADVVFSLGRGRDPKLGGFYGAVFARVKSIEATGDREVTIKLTQPDYFLLGELAATPGWIVQQKFVEAAGANFGNPTGGTMCSGSYKLGQWAVGEKLSLLRNDTYWDSAVKPKVAQIDIVGVSDATARTAGLLSGDIDGTYQFGALSTIDQLKDKVSITDGAGWNVDAFIVSKADGVLAESKVRNALSMALDRASYVENVYHGRATMPKSLVPPGTWGYGRDVFAAAYAALPQITQDLDGAKALVASLGIEGKSLVLGFVGEDPSSSAEAAMYKTAGEAIGLKVELKPVTADQYINFFIDANFRKSVDGFFTVNYGDFADPAALMATFSLPDGSQNYWGYNNPAVVAAFDAARGTADPDARAGKVAEAQALIMKDLPWIPTVFPTNTVITNKKLTGAVASFAYMFAPWANDLGGRG